jgi:hypothetical protein
MCLNFKPTSGLCCNRTPVSCVQFDRVPCYIRMHKSNFVKMKIFIILSIVALSTGCSSYDHLKFLGIPINGDLKIFTEELKKKGYQEAQVNEKDQMKFTGKFSERDCEVYLFTTYKSKTPYMVRVDFLKESHDSVRYNYERLKNHCASILGPGASKYQQFNNSSRFLFNEPKRVIDPKNGDYTRYLSRKGSVFLEVKFDYLSITFLDKKNSELSVAEGGKQIFLNY